MEIRKEWPLLLQNASISLGDGSRVSFWKDVWCRQEALCLACPSLFNLAAQKDATVAELWDHNRGEGGWNPIFLRSFNDWEMEEVERFLQVLHKQKIIPFIEVKILIKGSRNDAFSVKIMYLFTSNGLFVPLNLESSHSAQNWLLCLGGLLGQSAHT